MITDLTEGKPQRILFSFSLPLILSSMFQQFYNITDSIIAGNYIGEDALAAVGASYPVTMVFMSIAFGCNVGCSVIISQLFGSKDYKEMKTAINTSFISILSVSIILTLIGLTLCDNIISAINTPQNIFSDSSLYLGIFFSGMIFVFIYNICTGIFTALGDSKTPLFFLIFSSLGNIALDIILVVVFNLGIFGIAIATLIMQGISSVLAFICLHFRLKTITYEGKAQLFSLPMFVKIWKMAIPSILQQSFVSLGNILIQGVINTYGSATIAGYSAGIKINTFSLTTIGTFANALSSFVAQNVGAGKLDRVKAGVKFTLKVSIGIILVVSILYFIFAKQLIGLFLEKPTAESINAGATLVRGVCIFYVCVGIKIVLDGLLRGSGAIWLFTITTFSDLIIRTILAFVFNPFIGYVGVPISWDIGWVIGMTFSIVFYVSGLWKKHLNIE